jgi:adenylosuccinate synthase
MKNKAYVLAGMLLGDEGKGSFVDYLSFDDNCKQIIRYNGGAHAGHTVTLESGSKHQFSQLGSGSFLEGSRTYLSENMVVNPRSLVEESIQFAEKVNSTKEKILERVYINENSYIVTPYHRLIKRLKELSSAYSRRWWNRYWCK